MEVSRDPSRGVVHVQIEDTEYMDLYLNLQAVRDGDGVISGEAAGSMVELMTPVANIIQTEIDFANGHSGDWRGLTLHNGDVVRWDEAAAEWVIEPASGGAGSLLGGGEAVLMIRE